MNIILKHLFDWKSHLMRLIKGFVLTVGIYLSVLILSFLTLPIVFIMQIDHGLTTALVITVLAFSYLVGLVTDFLGKIIK